MWENVKKVKQRRQLAPVPTWFRIFDDLINVFTIEVKMLSSKEPEDFTWLASMLVKN